MKMAKQRKKRLAELFAFVEVWDAGGLKGLEVTGVTDDSRAVEPGMLFVAVAGMTVDGHRFVDDAVAKGCAAVLVNYDFSGDCKVPLLRTNDTMQAIGFIAAAFYGFPAEQMTMVGVTGTNGKTTSTYLLEAMIQATGGTPGIIGTVSVRFDGREEAASMTTPQAVHLQKLLRQMLDAGVTHVIMEVSSHALAQYRVDGIWFDVALFTNLSRDHLDFHENMESYFLQKKKLFTDHLKKEGKGVIVLEEENQEKNDWCKRLVEILVEKDQSYVTCGIEKGQIRVDGFQSDLKGISAKIIGLKGVFELESKLVGEFNLKNLLGAVGCGVVLGYEEGIITQGLSEVTGVPGRLERILADGQEGDISVFVDYAHTPDALENVLKTLGSLKKSRLVVVFGCGGDRDHGKRKLMGKVAAQKADVVILTSDNPRTEEPLKIISEIEHGINEEKLPHIHSKMLMEGADKGYDIIEERAEAIHVAISGAAKGDVVLISGKGHEDYQIVGDKKLCFDDRQRARMELTQTLQAA